MRGDTGEPGAEAPPTGPPPIHRGVKPRKPFTAELPIVVYSPSGVYSEDSGELHDPDQLGDVLLGHPSALLACANPETLLLDAHRQLREHPLWQFRLTPLEREKLRADGTTETRRENVISFLGFKRPNGRERARYFYPLAPKQFCRLGVRDLEPGGGAHWQLLLSWASKVREFCREFDLRPSPTSGGIAAQLLRHPLFYPAPRRKVPKATNEKVRPRLPGNHYELTQREDVPVASVLYIDQEDAHHSAAQRITLPDADTLRAHGRFRDADASAPWARPGSRAYAAVAATHGLFLARLHVPSFIAQRDFIPPYLRGTGGKGGEVDAYLYSNELAEATELGAQVRWLTAAWTSPEADRGLARYATWAREQVRDRPEMKPWLKPTLLSAYGILAAKPRHLETAYWRSRSGDQREVWIAQERVPVYAHRTRRPLQSPIANVIHRGMIEAETRRVSLALARRLEADGFDVLAVYADAVMVRDTGRPLPLLEHPWRTKDRLSHLIFHSPQAFTSREIKRLPGVPRRGTIRDANATRTRIRKRRAAPSESGAGTRQRTEVPGAAPRSTHRQDARQGSTAPRDRGRAGHQSRPGGADSPSRDNEQRLGGDNGNPESETSGPLDGRPAGHRPAPLRDRNSRGGQVQERAP